MNQGLIPYRYAKALYKVALERRCDRELYDLARRIAASFEEEPSLGDVMNNPFVDPAKKRQLLLTAAGADAAAAGADAAVATLDDFITLVERNKRISFFRDAALAYIDIYRKAHNISTVTVTSAAPLAAEASGRLKALIAERKPGAKIEYTERVDPSIIGGFTIAIDNERLDASIQTELKQLRLKLLSH